MVFYVLHLLILQTSKYISIIIILPYVVIFLAHYSFTLPTFLVLLSANILRISYKKDVIYKKIKVFYNFSLNLSGEERKICICSVFYTCIITFTGTLCLFVWLHIAIWCQLLLAWRISFSNTYQVNLLETHFLTFCSSDKVFILPYFLKVAHCFSLIALKSYHYLSLLTFLCDTSVSLFVFTLLEVCCNYCQ